MADGLRIQVDDLALRAKLKRWPQAIDRISLSVTYKIAEFGSNYLKANTPVGSTGASRDSFGYLITKNTQDIKQTTITLISSPHPEKKWKSHGWFNLPWYMLDSPSRALSQNWRSGNINNMRRTPSMLRDKFEGDMTIMVRKEIINK